MFHIPLWSFVFMTAGLWLYGLLLMSTKYRISHWIFEDYTPVTTWQYVQYMLVTTFVHALSQVAGHEIFHNKETCHKVVGSIPYVLSFNSHFWDEHVRNHHKVIATPEDPVSHPMGMSVYEAIVSSVCRTHAQSWDREQKRLKKLHKVEDLSWFTSLTQNRMVYYQLIHCGILWTCYQVGGIGGLKYQLVFATIGITWLEIINYLEHYGLRRMKDEHGIYESINCMHSWNSISSPVGFRLQRHSDHHAHSFRPYQILRRFDKAPYMPYEYIPMSFLALMPPLFMYIMDPRVKSIHDAQRGIVNEDQWNNEMPRSKADEKRHMAGLAYFATVSLIFTGLMLI